ncbi:MAG: response regulator transcription factor [Acidobacteria bacterium]|nr:response regulator transcription factor [Acidobacteriota bacterium]
MVTVCACDSQPIALEGLRSILEASEDIRFAGGAQSLLSGLELLERYEPTIMLLDRSFGAKPVVDWIASSKLRYPQTRTVVWATVISDVECFRALQVGAQAILKKTAPVPAILHCLRAVVEGKIWTENLYAPRDGRFPTPRARPLTPREQEIINLVTRGLRNREIAAALSIATGTVKIHMMHIFEKTGIRDRFELALYGLKLANAASLPPEQPLAPALPEDQGTLVP